MMQFRLLKESLINKVLGPSQGDRFVTIGYQRQQRSATEINSVRQVTVYYSESGFPRAAGQTIGEVMNDATYLIELVVATAAEGDLSVLNDDDATADQKIVAIEQSLTAAAKADASMDEFIEIIYQILMDARFADNMGLPDFSVSSRWVDQVRKDSPVPDGEFMMLTASMRLTCRMAEDITGDLLPKTPTDGVVIESDIELDGDEITKQGVEVLNTP